MQLADIEMIKEDANCWRLLLVIKVTFSQSKNTSPTREKHIFHWRFAIAIPNVQGIFKLNATLSHHIFELCMHSQRFY